MAPAACAAVTGPTDRQHRRGPAARALLILPAGIGLVAGIDAGLVMLDAWPPMPAAGFAEQHGALMVLGFLGTLISLERAVALGQRAGFLAPALLGAGGLLLLAEQLLAARLLLCLGVAALCVLLVPLWRRQRDDAVLLTALGAACLLGGTLLWAGGADVALVVPWWAGFVVLTIVGERLELARLALPPTAARDLMLVGTACAAAILATTLWPRGGGVAMGALVLVLAGWLAGYDIARRTVRSSGLPRFAAVCMLSGQVWLAVAGTIWLTQSPVVDGAAYDAVVHALFLGFAMSMVFAHAAIILPAVTRIPLPYRRAMWLPWVVLQASVLLRLYGGDLHASELARRLGGAGNGVALVLFVLVAVGSAAAARRRLSRDTQPAEVTS